MEDGGPVAIAKALEGNTKLKRLHLGVRVAE
jgi:hypothetical protein